MEQKPSIGRIVLFQSEGTIYPAIVVHVASDEVIDLHVFGAFFSEPVFEEVARGVPGEGEVHPGFWFWPPRVG